VPRSGIFNGFPNYVCRYTDLLWCCDMLKLKAPVHELVDLKGMIDIVICHLEAFLHIAVVGLGFSK